MRLFYQLTTIDPVIVSQTTATTNNHQCLDYIPGSAILGALAGEHYNNLSEEESWSAFHNGDVKYGPCYALTHNEIALPTPASWHVEKGNQNDDNKTLQNMSITNHAASHFERDKTKQYKQCRDGYFNSKGDIANIEMGNTTKTELDRKTGSAKDQQLFSYSYLQANQKFVGWIETENSELLEKLKTSLNKLHHIGRSRNTEFGRVSLEIINVTAPKISNNPKELVLWCLSDCEFIDSAGMPTLSPCGADIHPLLADATLSPMRSFIRTNRVNRFNQKRQGFDSEQILITKGSILTFSLKTSVSDEVLAQLSRGIGINQQYGLGWVSINPSWADKTDFNENEQFTAFETTLTSNKKVVVNATKSPLKSWLAQQIKVQENTKSLQSKVNELSIEIISLYQNARRYNTIINSNEAGPSSTQWSRIRMEVSKNGEQWSKAVFDGEQAICKATNDELGWGIKVYTQNGPSTFTYEINALLKTQKTETMRLLIEQLGRYDLSVYKDLLKAQKAFPEGVLA
jgi:CRISPR-associated protein Csx10